MKTASIMVLILSAFCWGDIICNFSQGQNPRVSYGFASADSLEALSMLSVVKYRSVYAIDSLMKIRSDFEQQDSISSLLQKKDGLCLISHHRGPVCHYFVFDMTPVYSLLGNDSITDATFKWSGKAVREEGGSLVVMFNTRQAGHLFEYCTGEDSITLDLIDTSFAISWWFSPGAYYFFEKELAVRVEIKAKTEEMYALYTDFVEIILHTGDSTGICLKPSPNSAITLSGFRNPMQLNMRYDVSGRKVNQVKQYNGVTVGASRHSPKVLLINR